MKKITYQINTILLMTIAILVIAFYLTFFQLQNRIQQNQLAQSKFLLTTIAAGEKRILIDEIYDRRIEAVKLHTDRLNKIDGIINTDVFSEKQLSLLNQNTVLGLPGGSAFDENDSHFIIKPDKIISYYRLAAAGEVVGYLRIDYSLAKLNADRRLFNLFFWTFLSILTAGLLAALYISLYHLIIKPVKKLTGTIQQIFNTGDFSKVDFSASPENSLDMSLYFQDNPDLNEIAMLRVSFIHLLKKQQQFTENLQEMVDKKSADLILAMKDLSDLKSMLPICSCCKKIRDDQGYWHQVENYISEHSGIDFSHSMCPDCVGKMYPEYKDKIINS